MASIAKSDHWAVIAYSSCSQCAASKTTHQHSLRPKTPNQHALFLQYIATAHANLTDNATSLQSNPQAEYDSFYSTAINLLDTFYPLGTITVTSWDRAKLRRKNRLMHAGRVEEAGCTHRKRHRTTLSTTTQNNNDNGLFVLTAKKAGLIQYTIK